MNVELKPCPFCEGEAEMMGDQHPYVECTKCAVSFQSDHSYDYDFDDAARKWNARSTAGPNLKPIAESKVRQLGGDVCGVLVRKDGKLAAVDEHGRVQWLRKAEEAEEAEAKGRVLMDMCRDLKARVTELEKCVDDGSDAWLLRKQAEAVYWVWSKYCRDSAPEDCKVLYREDMEDAVKELQSAAGELEAGKSGGYQ